MTTLIERPHEKYGSIMLAKNGTIAESTSKSDENNIEVITTELRGVTITSVYKPPPIPMEMPEIPSSGKPKIVIGDFNSHSTQWGYANNNADGDAVEIHKIAGLSKKLVLEPLPRTQHRPISITINAAITPGTVPFRRRFNFGKANWPGFQEDLERKIAHLPADPKDYDKFTKLVHKAARKNIPRGCHTQYILDAPSTELYERYQQLYESDPFAESTTEVGERLMTSLSEHRQLKWKNLLETTDMLKNSKKVWSLIRKISNDPSTPTQQQYTTTANQVAHQLLLNGKSTTKQPRPKVDRVKHSQTMGLTKPFSLEELNTSINTLKTGKAIRLDNIFTEEIKHFGPLMRKWSLELMNKSIEVNLTTALDELLLYYKRNHLHANPAKTQVCSFHLRNREANRPLNIKWCGTPLEHCTHPVYLGVTLDRTLSFKEHIKNTKYKVGSTHAKKLAPALNNTCRLITGCLKPTNTSNLHLLAGIAPADIRREVASRVEITKATSDERMSPSGPAAKVKKKFSQPCPAPNKVPGRNQNPTLDGKA
ncbi:hypothetical protein AAFF_G00416850 [Aldrovandia affinis]|uniref:Endonuclease/exonuclease/phosphatase domain-containing protein n=1 Tax=Aldrovandia affinis TaxID=143900 RepID=A0AAD7SAY7_9TELE|nr:hypothetical protein AAFF_G00416850 [Aldrovandia affinis]